MDTIQLEEGECSNRTVMTQAFWVETHDPGIGTLRTIKSFCQDQLNF